MSTPPARLPALLLGAAIAFWGYHNDVLAAALAFALVVEARRWLAVRLAIDDGMMQRVAIGSHALAGAVLAVLAIRIGVTHALIVLLQWLPACFAPLLLVHRYADSDISLWRLFVSPRSRPHHSPRWDPAFPFWALCILAAAVANARGPAFYLGVAALALWALWGLRARSAPLAVWLTLAAVAVGLGYAGQLGLRAGQLALEARFLDWVGDGHESNPYRSVTDLGHIGELKQSDRILLRLEADPGAIGERTRLPLLLHTATYDRYLSAPGRAPQWYTRGVRFEHLEPRPEPQGRSPSWQLAAPGANPPPGTGDTGDGGTRAGASRLRITMHTSRGRGLLALPGGTTKVNAPHALSLRRTRLGVTEITAVPGYLDYAVDYAPGAPRSGPPQPDDLLVPASEGPSLRAAVRSSGVDRGAPAAERIGAITAYLADGFRYATYRDAASAAPAASALAEFLGQSRAGHCEYFATAAVLLLRTVGIPARYATGFSVQEWSPLEGGYVVRQRHAHAWAEAWVDGGWRDVDTTPPAWFAEEARQASPAEGLLDALHWLRYRWSLVSLDAGGSTALGVLGGAGAALAIGWLARRLRRRRPLAPATPPPPAADGADSPFERVVGRLVALGFARDPASSTAEWVEAFLADAARRGQDPDAAGLRQALALHYRYRFDPGCGPQSPQAPGAGTRAQVRAELDRAVEAWLGGAQAGALRGSG